MLERRCGRLIGRFVISNPKQGSVQRDAISVVIIDALPLARYGLRALCAASSDMRCVASVPAADAGWAVVRRYRPRLVLLDSGLDPKARLIANISNTHADVTVVVLLRPEQQRTQYLQALRRAGNVTNVSRDTDPSSLLAVFRQALRSRSSAEWGHSGGLPRKDATDAPTLSARQLEVLVLLAHGHDNETIAEHLHLSAETVRTHVKAIFARLGAHNRAHAVTLAYHLGLLTTDIRGQPIRGEPDPTAPR